VRGKEYDAVKFLLKHGAKVNIGTSPRKVPLMIAIRNKDMKMIEMLF